MKKILLGTLALSISFSVFAQNNRVRSIHDLKPAANDRAVPVQSIFTSGAESPLRNAGIPQAAGNMRTTLAPTQVSIGNTTYDLQSNSSCVAARVYNSGNDIGAAYTISLDVAGAYPDRGTGVSRSADNGATWTPSPGGRIESKRTGFGSLDKLGSGECVISHAAGAPLTLFTHSSFAAPWDSSVIPYPAAFGYPLWNSMKVGGSNGTTIHMVTATAPTIQTPPGSLFNGMDGAMVYYRSLDGGLTWDIQNVQLPESDTSAASPYLSFGANNYAIDSRSDVVAVVSGAASSDWSLWKSNDNGTTFTRTPIMPFPIPKYDGTTMNTDLDSDGVGDTLLASDGDVAVVIDNNGMAHCFSGALLVTEDPGATGLGIFLSTNGLLYWNESMGANLPVVIAESPDRDGDGVLTFAANTFVTPVRYGNSGLCSHPTAGVDAFNNIYVAYTAMMENTDDGGLGFSYRNVWAQASTDGGGTWLTALNISNSDFDEAVYPSVARDVDNPGCLHLIWQQDGIPGTSVPPNGVHPIGVNDIIYSCVDPNVDLGVPTGVNENMASQNVISISPNPASDFIKFTFTLEKLTSIEMDIYNVNGQKVDHISQENASGIVSITVKTDQYSSGIYSVTSKVGDTSYTNKFVIN